jgi:hypothetical protein
MSKTIAQQLNVTDFPFEIIDNRPKDDVITLNGVKYKRIDE